MISKPNALCIVKFVQTSATRFWVAFGAVFMSCLLVLPPGLSRIALSCPSSKPPLTDPGAQAPVASAQPPFGTPASLLSDSFGFHAFQTLPASELG
jgi:hypothetical protein